MKKNIAKIFVIAMFMFVPSAAKADIDVLSALQDSVTSYMGKINSVVKKYINIQVRLQELSLNRDILSQIRDEVKTQLKAQATKLVDDVKDMAVSEFTRFIKTSLSSVSLPGIGQYIDAGAFVNPKLTVAVGETYIKRQHKDSDVAYNLRQDEKRNDLMVQNASILFANSLVRRVQIIEEDPCRCVGENGALLSDIPNCGASEKTTCEEQRKELSELEDVNLVKSKYYETVMRGHERWGRISEAYSSYRKMLAEARLGQGNVEDITDVTGVEEENKEDKEKDNAKVLSDYLQKQREANSLALSGTITNGINQIKNGDALGAVAGAMGAATNLYGNAPGSWSSVTTAMKETTTGLNSANEAYKNAKNGNWGNAIGAVAVGAGTIVVDTTGNRILGAATTTGGNLTGVGLNAANNGISWDNINNTLGQTQNALGTLGNAYDEQSRKDAEIVKAKEEAERKAAAAEDAARKKEAEDQAKADCIACRASGETPWCIMRCSVAGM